MPLTRDELKAAYYAAGDALDAGNVSGAEGAVGPVQSASADDVDAAECLAYALLLEGWPLERRRELAVPLLRRWSGEARIVLPLANGFESFVDMRLLNEAPPTDAASLKLLEAAAQLFARANGDARAAAADALYGVARLSGRGADALCEKAILTAVELKPSDPGAWYRLGLFFKTRGRFKEGMAANQRAVELSKEPTEAMWWNLGICATGAGEGRVALGVWVKQLGCKLELGADGLPAGGFPHVKIQLVERPAATRSDRDDSPGERETVWLERLSPCHGRVINATFGDLSADFGDLVLFDGAAITKQQVDGREVLVFPQLVTLARGGWSIHRFTARLEAPNALEALSEALPATAFLYSHTDSVFFTCNECFLAGAAPDRCAHQPSAGERMIEGKLCVEPGASLGEVDRALSQALRARPGDWLLSPSWARALGDTERAHREAQRLAGLREQRDVRQS